VWRHTPIGAGRAKVEGLSRPELREWEWSRRRSIIWEADGVESSVALSLGDGYAFMVNGKSDGDSRADAGTQVMAGLVGALRHPSPKRSLVIGLGTGSTAGWLGQVPGMQAVDVYELEPVIRRVAEAASDINANVMHHPLVHIHYGDARELLLASDSEYDVIFSEPSNPFRAGIASLFTLEYYEAVRHRLRADGIFAQWVQAYEIDADTVQTIYATLHRVFPDIETWQTSKGDILLVASSRLQPMDIALLSGRLTAPAIQRAITGAWRTSSVEGLLAHYIANQRFANQFAADGVVNTDDRNVVEFGFARTVGRKEFSLGDLRAAAVSAGLSKPDQIKGSVDWNRVLIEGALAPTLEHQIPERAPHPAIPALADASIAYYAGDFRAIGPIPDGVPGWMTPLISAMGRAVHGDVSIEQKMPELMQLNPIEARLALANLRITQNRHADAARLLIDALNEYHHNPWPEPKVMGQAITAAVESVQQARIPELQQQLAETLRTPFSLDAIGHVRRRAALDTAMLGSSTGCDAAVVDALHRFEPNPLWTETFLQLRARCYEVAGDPLAEHAAKQLAAIADDLPSRIHLSQE
jgi:spermidine synthase